MTKVSSRAPHNLPEMTWRIPILVVAVAVASAACQKSSHPAAPTTVPDTSVDVVPRADQTFVTGSLTSLSADNAAAPALQPPFIISLGTRGQTHADITGVLVAGKNSQIFWYGGQPLPVRGTGTLDLSGAPVAIAAGGITWVLDGPPRSLTAGHFVLGAPVAVGTTGLAEPHDNVAFDAGAKSTIQTVGNATVHLPPAPIHLAGPGKLTLAGDLGTRTANARRTVKSITFGPGSYSIDLTPSGAGYSINGTIQGPVTFA